MVTYVNRALSDIAEKVFNNEQVNADEGVMLYTEAPLAWLGSLAAMVRERFNGKTTWYNRNFHIEPTNRCIYNCRFCSYNEHNSGKVWDYTLDEMAALSESAPDDITELHIVGGVAPGRGTEYYAEMLKRVRHTRPDVHLKAFSAIELSYMARVDGISISMVLKKLVEAGLDSIPGGGAEIFDSEIRKRICPEKDSAERWLEVHRAAHRMKIPTNATMLYGHIENYHHRVDHLIRIRDLQDETKGFQAFIPLKYKNANNPMSVYGEVSVTEDLKNYAVSRIILDNIPHIKAYWPMIGRETAGISQSFGVDDLDGTINDSTSIYTVAGSAEVKPVMNVDQISSLISDAGFIPQERDSLYKPVNRFISSRK